VPLLLMALLAMGLPVNIGGWGPREGIAALGFWMAGLGAPLGITTSVAYGVLALIASLPGGVILLVRRAARVRAEKGLALAEHQGGGPTATASPITAPIPVVEQAPRPVPRPAPYPAAQGVPPAGRPETLPR
jgi:hypothetical protein